MMRLFSSSSAQEKRKRLKPLLRKKGCLRFAGSFHPVASALIEEAEFDGLYVSGAAASAAMGFPDAGLATLSEMTDQAERLTRGFKLPSIADGDTGFGGGLNCARLVEEMERKGLSGLHIEDQKFPKRCGHLDNKKLISVQDMILKIQAARRARSDKNFLIIARTDAYAELGLSHALERAHAYIEAGADMIFPEALPSLRQFELFKSKLQAPMLANMTEFGKTKIIPFRDFKNAGCDIVIYPVTTLRIALKAVEEGLRLLRQDRQKKLLPALLTRERLYQLLRYKDYKLFDKSALDFDAEC